MKGEKKMTFGIAEGVVSMASPALGEQVIEE